MPLPGIDQYSFKARFAPALLALAPLVALAIAGLPYLPGYSKFWSLTSVGLVTLASLWARKAGNRVQPELWDAWGGAPTTSRLRFRDDASRQEISRRHSEVEDLLGGGLTLPDAAQELADPRGADAEYAAAARRVINFVRDQQGGRLLEVENRNYGFSRNLYGLKRVGVAVSIAVVAISLPAIIVIMARDGWEDASALFLALAVAAGALLLWRVVDPEWVRPSANAYADRVLEAVQVELRGR